MPQFKAQIISKSADISKGYVRVASIHDRVINLHLENGSFLCLHQNDAPLSPMGLWLKKNDFAQIKNLIKPSEYLQFDGKFLQHKTFSLQIAAKKISLQMPSLKFNAANHLKIMASLDKKTGLFGTLNQALSNLEREEFKPYFAFIEQIMAHKTPIALQHLLGKGLGLTPSSDDVVIGILAVLWSSPKIKHYLQLVRPFATYDLWQLNKYTTWTSVNYVVQALSGNFASPLWHFLVQFEQSDQFFKRLRSLLNCGHSSGADTLLGIFLAIFALKKLQ